MNLLKKISLVYTLQVSAVVIIFAYPGCSSAIVQNRTPAENAAKKTYTGTERPVLNTGQLADSPVVLIQTQIAPSFFLIKPGK